MSKLTRMAILRFEMTGRIVLSVSHASAAIKTYYTSMTPNFDAGLDEGVDSSNHATVKVDLRKLSQVLNLQYMSYDDAHFYVADNNALLLHVRLGEDAGHITYYVPIVELDVV